MQLTPTKALIWMLTNISCQK